MGTQPDVIVVGGGWAGLAAGVELTRRGASVTLLESARHLGGRARCVRFGTYRVDNGQHLTLGAYHAPLELLRLLEIEESQVFLRRPLRLELHSARGAGLRMEAVPLPAPFHMLGGLLAARGLSLREKLAAGRLWKTIRTGLDAPHQDVSVAELLQAHDQPERLVTTLWKPLCLAALNTPVREASAELFLRVLRLSFAGRRRDSDFLIPRTDLGTAVPEPARDYIERHGGKVLLGRRVTALRLQGGQVAGIEAQGSTLKAGHVVLAVPPGACRRLLAPHPPLQPIGRRLGHMAYQPICTIYLRYPAHVRLECELVGLLDGLGQWVFDRTVCGQPGLIAVVISADGPHMAMDNDVLADTVVGELAALYPHWPPPVERMVIREKRATFSARAGVNALRPAARTPVHRLWLAGDFVATGLPATLEGAVRSGLECARHIAAGDDS